MASQRQMVLTINQDLTRQGQAKLIKAQTLREELEFGDYYTINSFGTSSDGQAVMPQRQQV